MKERKKERKKKGMFVDECYCRERSLTGTKGNKRLLEQCCTDRGMYDQRWGTAKIICFRYLLGKGEKLVGGSSPCFECLKT